MEIQTRLREVGEYGKNKDTSPQGGDNKKQGKLRKRVDAQTLVCDFFFKTCVADLLQLLRLMMSSLCCCSSPLSSCSPPSSSSSSLSCCHLSLLVIVCSQVTPQAVIVLPLPWSWSSPRPWLQSSRRRAGRLQSPYPIPPRYPWDTLGILSGYPDSVVFEFVVFELPSARFTIPGRPSPTTRYPGCCRYWGNPPVLGQSAGTRAAVGTRGSPTRYSSFSFIFI